MGETSTGTRSYIFASAIPDLSSVLIVTSASNCGLTPLRTARNDTMAAVSQSPGIGSGDHLVLVDGSGFLFRAYYALPKLTRKSDSLPIGAVSGFCGMLIRLLQEGAGDVPATHIAVAFDHSGRSFRNRIYPEYKAHRPPPPADLVPQFPLVREAVQAFNVACVELEDFEADDLIATYASQAEEAGARVTILSSDKDLMQMVSDRVRMLDTMKNVSFGPGEVREKFGVDPGQMVDLQALAGDSTDNVPGAPGIGVKTAAMLIEAFGDLDGLLARADEIRQVKRRAALVENVEQIRTSRELVRLDIAAPVPLAIGQLRAQPPEQEVLAAFLQKMEFRTLTRRAESVFGWDPVEQQVGTPSAVQGFSEVRYEIIRDVERLRTWIDGARDSHVVAIDTETDSLDEMRARLVGVSLALTPGDACYVPLGHRAPDGDLFDDAAQDADLAQIPLSDALGLLRALLEDPSILKIGHNIKYDSKVLARHGVAVAPIDDTMLMSYVLYAGQHRHGLDDLSARYLGHEPQSIKELIGTGRNARTFAEVPIERAGPYAAEDADVALRLRNLFRPALVTQGLNSVYESLERPLVPVLADMERAGMRVDPVLLRGISVELKERLDELESQIHDMAGETFNVASPKQLGRILFDRLGLPGAKKTGKSGDYQTGAGVLETLAAGGAVIAERVLEWRQLSKLKGTYADALLQHINPDTRRVHTSFSLAATTTGRLASSDPNLQNIPVRTKEGRRIREAFVAEPGCVLISLDYSQIELRMLAHMAGIEALRVAFHVGHDIHAMTAAEVFGVPIEGMDPMVRRRAKAINFGVIYGISEHGLSIQLGITRTEARAFINAYFERFPGIRAYMRDTVAFARDRGFVETLFGRRVHTPDINAKGPRRAFQERAAINAPIQGGAADIIRRAMVRIPGALKEEGLAGRMILQVHDELLFEVPVEEADEIARVAGRIMERAAEPAIELAVPIVVDAGRGENWAEAH